MRNGTAKLTAILAVTAFVLAATAQAQQKTSSADESRAQVISLPTGNSDTSPLVIEAHSPETARAGEQFQYPVKITNNSKHMTMENIRIEPRGSEGLDIIKIQESSQAGDTKQQGQKQQSGQKQQAWTISRLRPGESATAEITAIGNQTGKVSTCLGIHFEPMVCLTTNITKPELAVTKTAPKEANLCHPIALHYEVKNTGTGTTASTTLHDPLPEGWKMVTDGAHEVRFDVGRLEAGQTKQFDTQVWADRSGEFGSRAVAESQGGLRNESGQPTTRVIASDLAVKVTGPKAIPVGEAATYEIHVTNQGDATANDVYLSVDVPKDLRVVNASQEFNHQGSLRVFNLGTIESGKSKDAWIRTSGTTTSEKLGYRFVASTECSRRWKDIRDTVATIETGVISMPGLLLAVNDDKDPVQTGDNVTYQITVFNQGNAPAKNIHVQATLPNGFQFQEARGISQAKAEGNKVTFQPVDQIAPKDQAVWHLTAKVNQGGTHRLQVELKSDSLQKAVVAAEPTNSFAAGQEESRSAQKPGASETKTR